MTFKDHFSGHAEDYDAYRPTYPEALFAYLASVAPARKLAWDCATGNGQAAVALIPWFERVVGTDASRKQLDEARAADRITYLAAPAERTPLPDASVDLVTVAQALHWFNLPAFYAEVRRVVRPGGILAAWCYQLHEVTPEVDAVLYRLYAEILDAYWPPERRLVEEGYRTLPFPSGEFTPPSFHMHVRWNLDRVLGYLGTWSATRRYRQAHSADPLDLIRDDMKAAWGEPERERDVIWPLHVRVARIGAANP